MSPLSADSDVMPVYGDQPTPESGLVSGRTALLGCQAVSSLVKADGVQQSFGPCLQAGSVPLQPCSLFGTTQRHCWRCWRRPAWGGLLFTSTVAAHTVCCSAPQLQAPARNIHHDAHGRPGGGSKGSQKCGAHLSD